MAETKKIRISLAPLLAELMKKNGVPAFENARVCEVGITFLEIEYEVPAVRIESQVFAGVKFSVSDTVLLGGISEEGRNQIERFGKIWRIHSSASADKWFATPLAPSYQGKFKGTERNAKVSSSHVIVIKKNEDPSFVAYDVSKFPNDFHWKLFDK